MNERTAQLIPVLRQLMGDEYEREQDNVPITDPLTQDGEFTAQAMATALSLAARKLLQSAQRELVDVHRFARMFNEYVDDFDPGFIGKQGKTGKYELPADFGWLITARFRPENGKAVRVMLGDSMTAIDKLLEETNVEEANVARGWVQGNTFVVAYTNTDGSFDHSDLNTVQLRYVKLQPMVVIGTDTDIIMRGTWDHEIVQFAKVILMSFKD